MNLKRAFQALWEDEPVTEEGIPVTEELEVVSTPVVSERAKFIPHEPVDHVKELINESHDNN